MEKRVIIAFVLSFAVLYASRALFSPPQPPPGTEQKQNAERQLAKSTAVPENNPPAAEKPPENIPRTAADLRAERTEDFVVETPLYKAVMSNEGAVLKSYTLKAFTDAKGNPLELINPTAGSKVGWPLAMETGDKTVDDELTKANFVGRRQGDSVVFEFAKGGLYARKIVTPDPENYLFSVQTVLTKDERNIAHSLVWQGDFGDQGIVAQDQSRQNVLYETDSTYKRAALRGLKDTNPPENEYSCGWFSKCPTSLMTPRSGVEDQYFAAISLTPAPSMTSFRRKDYTDSAGKSLGSLVLSVAPHQGEVRYYVGPKQREWLSKVDPDLSSVLDFGTFSFIARPLLALLLWIHRYIGNFGWSIILLTIVLNLVLFPLRLKQQVSMLKMQKIQPQMRRLQDQYKKLKPNDQRRAQVQAEMMNLYKEHGVNPMGGCFPLLLQMPLLFGFYSALSYSIELRHAPWILWIKDLSQYDPYYVIPILMAVAMFVQQKMTPTANVDPAQAKMMMIMPLMFTFMFLFYSSGLALYWLTGSIIGIGQQVFINKYWSPQAEAKLRARSRPDERSGT